MATQSLYGLLHVFTNAVIARMLDATLSCLTYQKIGKKITIPNWLKLSLLINYSRCYSNAKLRNVCNIYALVARTFETSLPWVLCQKIGKKIRIQKFSILFLQVNYSRCHGNAKSIWPLTCVYICRYCTLVWYIPIIFDIPKNWKKNMDSKLIKIISPN